MRVVKFTRKPATAQIKAEVRSAFNLYQQRAGNPFYNSMHFGNGALFETPAAPDTAAQAAEAQAKQEAAIVEKAAAAVEAKLGKQLNGLSAGLRTITDGWKTFQEQAKPKVEAEGTEGKIKELQAALATQQKETNDRIAAAELKDKQSAIRSVIPQGLGEKKAKILFNHVVAEHGQNIKIENGEVVFADPIRGVTSTMSEMMQQILTGPDGDMFKVAPGAGPETKGLGRQQSPDTTTAVGDMSPEQLEKELATPAGRARLYRQVGKEMGR